MKCGGEVLIRRKVPQPQAPKVKRTKIVVDRIMIKKMRKEVAPKRPEPTGEMGQRSMPQPSRETVEKPMPAPRKPAKGKFEVEAGAGVKMGSFGIAHSSIKKGFIHLGVSFGTKILVAAKRVPWLNFGVGLFGWMGRLKDYRSSYPDLTGFNKGALVGGFDAGSIVSMAAIRRQNLKMEIETGARIGAYVVRGASEEVIAKGSLIRPYVAGHVSLKIYPSRNFYIGASLMGGGDISRLVGLTTLVKRYPLLDLVSEEYTNTSFFQAMISLGVSLPF